ncbi:MAG: hypothetical protein HC918_12095 [Oscillatoriales cyanobacterium SM2_1_8]|nr:hypothetical protein [Oscillatoriales cyanobacterium SM2_1_8]
MTNTARWGGTWFLGACFWGMSATIAPMVAQAPPVGWREVTGRGVAVQLPPSFEGGDLEGTMPEVLQRLRLLGQDFEPTVQAIAANRELFVLYAFDRQRGKTGALTNLNIGAAKSPANLPLATIVDLNLKQLPKPFRVVSRQWQGQTAVLKLEAQLEPFQISQLQYFIQRNNMVYVLTYTTERSEFAAREPVFRQSAATFRAIAAGPN